MHAINMRSDILRYNGLTLSLSILLRPSQKWFYQAELVTRESKNHPESNLDSEGLNKISYMGTICRTCHR